MDRVYSTSELIEILAQERQACMAGQRLNLQALVSGNPIVDQFLQTEGIQKFSAYQNFRATIHQYQRDHGVSGVVEHQVSVGDRTLTYPAIDDQLIALPQDLDVIRAAKPHILDFWHAIIPELNLFLSVNRGRDYRPITAAEVAALVDRTEWAALHVQPRIDGLEVVLQLGWGNPAEARYRRGWPESGSEVIHAVPPNLTPIC